MTRTPECSQHFGVRRICTQSNASDSDVSSDPLIGLRIEVFSQQLIEDFEEVRQTIHIDLIGIAFIVLLFCKLSTNSHARNGGALQALIG